MAVTPVTVPLRGGIDLVSAYLDTKPGRVIDALNFECVPTGGYQRISGYRAHDGGPGGLPLPGVGPVRGVALYKGVVYAVRDVDAMTAQLYRATGSGWQPVPLGSHLRFNAGKDFFEEGQIVTGMVSGATARVRRVNLGGGLIDSETAFGRLTVDQVTGVFVANEGLSVAGMRVAETLGTLVQTTLPANGMFQFAEHNFYGQAEQSRLYGVSGTGDAFEYDGEVFATFENGASAPPVLIRPHKDHLFLGYRNGSIIHSSIGEPLEFSALTGAAEIPVGDQLTDLFPLAGGALAVAGRNSISVLYGNDSETWQLQRYADHGARAYTMREIGGRTLLLDDRGVLELAASQSFGDFSSTAVSRDLGLQILNLARSRGDALASVSYSKSQYRLFFGDLAYYFTYDGPNMVGVMPVKLGVPVRCIIEGENTLGNATTYFGSDDGKVYELDATNFFDGNPILSRLQLSYMHLGAPTQRKRYRRAVFDTKIEGEDATIYGRALFELGAGPSTVFEDVTLPSGGASFYNAAVYDQSRFSAPIISRLNIDCEGLGESVSLLLLHEGIEDTQFTFFGMTLHYSMGRLNR